MKKLITAVMMFAFMFFGISSVQAEHPTEHPTKAKAKSFLGGLEEDLEDAEEDAEDLKEDAEKAVSDHPEHPKTDHPE